MNSKWRPMMGWMYMLVCTMDMIVFPILWSLLQTTTGTAITQWNPLTLQGAGLFHIAMGAVLGIAAFGRTQEKLSGANNGGAQTPTTGFSSGPSTFGQPQSGASVLQHQAALLVVQDLERQRLHQVLPQHQVGEQPQWQQQPVARKLYQSLISQKFKKEYKMKLLLALATSLILVGTAHAAAEIKEICSPKMDSTGKPVMDKKTGKQVQNCKKIKVHKKVEGEKVPEKKK
jgi:hypothetical protein